MTDDNIPSLHDKLVASLIRLQASFVLAPGFRWSEAVQAIDFEAAKIFELFEAEFGKSREVADLVEHLLVGTEFEVLDLDSKVRALYQDWVDTNRNFATVNQQREYAESELLSLANVLSGIDLPGSNAHEKFAELVRRYRELYVKTIGIDVQSSGISTELAEARATIARLEAEAQQRLQGGDDTTLLNELLAELEPGTYRDSLEERLANPLRQRLGLPRQFENVPAPDCGKVRTQSGATYMRQGSRWLCTFAPFGNGESREQTGEIWEHSSFLNFRPFIEVLDGQQRTADL